MSHEPKRLVFWRPPGSCLQVTARTWQAMSAALPADAKARMSVYTNDLYSNAGAAPLATCPLSPVYQAASARPATPSATPAPRSAERLQHQRIATPSRLQSEAGSPRGMQRLQQLPGLGLSTGNVPAAAPAPAALAQLQAEAEARPSTAPAPQLRTSTISLASLKHPAPAEAATQQEQQQGQQLLPAAVQHQAVEGTEGAATASSPRTIFPADGSISRDSPRVRQQVLRNFAGAVPAGSGSGGSSPLGNTPRPMLHGERAGGGSSGGERRPATPSFQPMALPRPATALAGPAVGATSADSPFSIKAGYGGTESRPLGQVTGGEVLRRQFNAYPQPPQTAPSKAAVPAGAATPAVPLPGSLASFGISAAAFVSAPDKAAAGAAARGDEQAGHGDGGAKAGLMAPTQASMLASTAFATKADLRWAVRKAGRFQAARSWWGLHWIDKQAGLVVSCCVPPSWPAGFAVSASACEACLQLACRLALHARPDGPLFAGASCWLPAPPTSRCAARSCAPAAACSRAARCTRCWWSRTAAAPAPSFWQRAGARAGQVALPTCSRWAPGQGGSARAEWNAALCAQ